MVKHVPFKHYYMGSNPVGLNGYKGRNKKK